MKAFTLILVVVGTLFLADLSWRIWIWHSEALYRTQFRFESFYTNGAKVFGIEEAKTGRPLLVMFDTPDGEKPSEVSYFFHGTNILDIYLKKGESPLCKFIFHGPGKSQEWWMNLGGEPSFTARVSYDTNGDRSGYDVLYANAWHPIVRRGDHNGIIDDGQWQQLTVDTNTWTVEAASTNHF